MTHTKRIALAEYTIAANAHALAHRMSVRFRELDDNAFAASMQETSRLKYKQMVAARKRYNGE